MSRRHCERDVASMILDIDEGHKRVAAQHVGACKWVVGAQTRRVGSQLPPAPTKCKPCVFSVTLHQTLKNHAVTTCSLRRSW